MTSNQPRLLMSTPGTSATEQEMDFPTFGEILAPPRAAPPTVAARKRIVSAAGIRLDHRKSVRPFKGIIFADISEFESYMPSHAVGLSQVRSPRNRHAHNPWALN
jgi:hypothetical protein